MAAGLELRTVADLERGDAVSWDFCRDRFAEHAAEPLEPVTAELAGRHLAAIAGRHDLTVHETFLTDLAGHLKRGVPVGDAIGRLDDVVAGLEAARPAELTWLLTSDHGNLEDISTGSHTTHPVPLLVVGPAAGHFGQLRSILDVTPQILRLLGTPG
jgi:bisphosphoglycerate-independent phosphoglycerate mutase (AlkP superfamily)